MSKRREEGKKEKKREKQKVGEEKKSDFYLTFLKLNKLPLCWLMKKDKRLINRKENYLCECLVIQKFLGLISEIFRCNFI